MDVKIKQNQSEELEESLPIDRVITIINGCASLYDKQFAISEDMIEEIINDK